MARKKGARKTIVGNVDAETLAYTAGDDLKQDLCLVNADCIGSAAHVTMLAGMPIRPGLFSTAQKDRLIAELIRIMREAREGTFAIALEDQDVHLAIERVLTERLGDSARAIHTARSRNDQVAVDLRLYGKEQLLSAMDEALGLSSVLVRMAQEHRAVPMVGRTHMRPAMPSSVGLWASAYAESLVDDVGLLRGAYESNDQCPLGSAAGYGVPLPIDRQSVSDLLGFRQPLHNVLHAGNTRGKVESVMLFALSQVMITLSRMAQDLMIYSMPEFDYFVLPREMGTGSSIMPQKNNPDVLELVRARACGVIAATFVVMDLVKGLPGGYSRDLQETKEPFFKGFRLTRSSLRILVPLIKGIKLNRKALLAGFCPAVFATDYALDLVIKGKPFRDAYSCVKEHLGELERMDPAKAIARRKHMGGTAGLDFNLLASRIAVEREFVSRERKRYYSAISKLLKVAYPLKD